MDVPPPCTRLSALWQALDIVDPYVLGFTCREVGRWLMDYKDASLRLRYMKKLLQMVIEVENKWEILDIGFPHDSEDMRGTCAHLEGARATRTSCVFCVCVLTYRTLQVVYRTRAPCACVVYSYAACVHQHTRCC